MEVDLIKTLSKYGEEITTIFRKLRALTILDEGQKLSIYDNVLCIDGTWYPSIQSFTRFMAQNPNLPKNQLDRPIFSQYSTSKKNIKKKQSIMNIDEIPEYF